MGKVAITIGVAVAAMLVGGGCGGDDSGGSRTLKWYVFAEPSGAFKEAADNCTKQANGRYKVEIVDLPTNADQQRELVVRRLAAEDSDIDIIGMDVIWTAEFAEAEWIKEVTGRQPRRRPSRASLPGPLETAKYKGRLWTVPFTSNTQLLWYRKDLVKQVPKTWDEMIDQAERLKTTIQVQSARYEGLVVWFNSLVASAGGEIVDDAGDPVLGAARRAGRRGDEAARELVRRAPGDDEQQGGPGAARLRVRRRRPSRSTTRSCTRAPRPARRRTRRSRRSSTTWAGRGGRASMPGKPSRVTLGGINLGVGSYSKNPDLAQEAALCLAQPDNQVIAAEKGGLAPSNEALYDDERIKKAFPFADLLRRVDRHRRPAAGDARRTATSRSPSSRRCTRRRTSSPRRRSTDLKDNIETVSNGGIF